MRNNQKKVTFFLVGMIFISVVFVILCYCISKKKEESTIHTVNILVQKNQENCQDLYLVEKELNNYLAKTEDFQIHLKAISSSDYESEYMHCLRSGEETDLIISDKKQMINAVNEGLLMPLDELLEKDGAGILELLNTDYTDTGYIGDVRYGISSVRDYAMQACFEYSKEIAREYDLDMENIENLDDLEKVFKKLQSENLDIVPVGSNLYIGVDALLKIDTLGDDYTKILGVLQDYGQNTEVVSLYDTTEFEQFVKRMYRWQNNGWLMEETGATMSAINYLKSGKVLGCFSHYHPGFDIEETRGSGTEIGCVVMGEAFINSFNVNHLFWEISSKSKNPEYAMKFLQKLYCDSTVVQYLSYGIEGVHYEYKDDEKNTVGYPEGIGPDSSRYSQFLGWTYGNETLTPVWEGMPENLWQQIIEYNEDALLSRGMDFCFDTESVQNEITACGTVLDKYYLGLINGKLNPDKYLTILQDELKTAGIDKVIQEKQQQLNEYLEDKY